MRRAWVLVAGLALMWLWMTPLTTKLLGLPLEREWLVDGKVPRVESFLEADAIVLLGGGMGAMTNASPYAEMWTSADRVWQAARLYKAGKASCIFVTGKGNEISTKGLLVDFGIPTNAMMFVDQARNTEEEARAIAQQVGGLGLRRDCRILLVTSAWHMKRAKLVFEKYAPGLEIIPAPADFEVTTTLVKGFRWDELYPKGQYMMINEACIHEWLGYFGYKWLR